MKFKIQAEKIIVSSHSTITTKSDSVIECTIMCKNNRNCMIASYDSITKQCKLDSDSKPKTERLQTGKIAIISHGPTDCSENPQGSINGVYRMFVNNSYIDVYCDMVADGWTVIQRRLDGSIDFYREWADYKKGFGRVSGEYWLGNDNIFNILNRKSYSLRFDVQDWSGEWRYAQYEMFKLADESNGYEITLSGYTGNAGDAMLGSQKYLTDTRFSTKDRDNDDMPTAKCTDHTNGGWWYQGLPERWCTKVNPNGRYSVDDSTTSMFWYPWKSSFKGMKSITMKIKHF
ncbi:Ficolin-1-A,Angiopoietin-2,Ficolin-2,Ficolin-1,Fibrinogen-like protein A,Angiopoietin-related protein 7,Angiopoietin-4,Techylectin-like protein [Mytilus edulis]|uniref:Ficolin-1-A,Angiopoietin-2,Ficolin-2,Ficolin-1,Fi brinogen-like protein A,Angiopoietin-related protein 7,Angiopoietin-4,Techylectin-like protein n=1 Tax=Mytilus edulis TaxID=6550 RepID=A0A8S3RNW2_MYTED|nr:Ficolin-1-A,Angiopoietin-2,Ficolin-2,Ficolin-1,Fibrinogen-like protein A,Angiopoietin-related protein 7,Angiopoietin-4,Techylectin-like protein [Mytilus edulis]